MSKFKTLQARDAFGLVAIRHNLATALCIGIAVIVQESIQLSHNGLVDRGLTLAYISVAIWSRKAGFTNRTVVSLLMATFSFSEMSELSLLVLAGFADASKSAHTPDVIEARLSLDLNILYVGVPR